LLFYLDLLRNSRKSFEIDTKSWLTLSGLAVSLHEPKLCHVSRAGSGENSAEPEAKFVFPKLDKRCPAFLLL